jgi:GntR family phosphonate transport system transcriptional regulator
MLIHGEPITSDMFVTGVPTNHRYGGGRSVEHRRGTTLWGRIAATLAQEIRSGQYQPGDRLPTEAALSARFQVNRHTLRRAMAALQDDGLIRIEQGRGTFVQEDVIDYPLARRTRFSEIIIGADREPHSQILRTAEQPATAEAAAALLVPDGEPLLVIETLHLADGRPLSVTAHHFPKRRFDGLVERFRESGSITQALYALGVRDYFRDGHRIGTRMPDDWEARQLRQPATLPILVSQHTNVDVDGRPIEFAVARYAGRRVQLVFNPR